MLAAHGTFNMLLSNGQALWAHGSTQPVLASSAGTRSPTPRLRDEDLTRRLRRATTPNDRVAVIATEPLTADEAWTAFAPGELRVFVDGARALNVPVRAHPPPARRRFQGLSKAQ